MAEIAESRRRVLVTGAHGLLGTWLVRALLERGDVVVVIRRDRPPRSGLALMGLESRVTVLDGDICQEGLIARALTEYELDTVFHLAAQTLVPIANRAPVSTFETNIRGTWILLEACRAAGIERVIVASSDKAYGPHLTLPYRELTHALQPVFPYDVSKAAADLLSRCYWHTYGLPVAVTRCANLYGGGDFNGSRLIPEAITAALAGRSPVIRSDGAPQRDFLYVEDAVAAYLAIADALDAGPARGEAFNVGGGEPHRILDVVRLICSLAGADVEPEIQGTGTPAAELDRQWVDHAKLTALTGWRPVTSLETGLGRTLDWYRRHGGAG